MTPHVCIILFGVGESAYGGVMQPEGQPVDRLTGLPSREVLEALDAEFRVRGAGDVWSILLMDIDGFSAINEAAGHMQGDRVLQQIAYMLVRNVKQQDMAFRMGGDEFAVVLPSTTEKQAANLAQRIIENLSSETFPGRIEVTMSMGLVGSTDEDRSLEPVMARAVEVLGKARASGRGRLALLDRPAEDRPVLSFEHFVNRQEELRILRQALDSALSGESTAVLISGEPGVGKTRLAEELRHYSGFRSCLYASSRFHENASDAGRAFMGRLLAGLYEMLDETERAAVVEETGPVHPHSASLVAGVPLSSDAHGGSARGSERDIDEDLCRMLVALTGRRPVVLHLDDIQLAETQDLHLIGRAARKARDSKLLLVMTMQAPLEEHPLHRRWLEVQRLFTRLRIIDLAPLRKDFASNMVMLALRGSRLDQGAMDRLADLGAGNPYFIREAVRVLLERDPTGGASGDRTVEEELAALPGDLPGLLRARLDRLDRMSREILRLGALVPGGFTLDQLSFLLESPRVDAARALEKPIDLDIIGNDVGPAGEGRYCFTHDCLREILVTESSAGVRRAISSRLGSFHEDRYRSGSPGDLFPAARCHLRGLDPAKAGEFALLAAEDARERHAGREEAEWLERYTALPASCPSLRTADRFQACLRLGGLLESHGRHADSEKALSMASELATSPEERAIVEAALGGLFLTMEELEPAETQLSLACAGPFDSERTVQASSRLALVQFLGEKLEEAAATLERTRALVPGPNGHEASAGAEGTYLQVMGRVTTALGDMPGGLPLCRKAVEVFRGRGDTSGQASAMVSLASALTPSGAWEERIRLLTAAASLQLETCELHRYMSTLAELAQVHLSLGQIRPAREHLTTCHDLADVVGASRMKVWSTCLLGIASLGGGSIEEALRHFGRSLSLAQTLGYDAMAFLSSLKVAVSLSRLGSHAQARGILKTLDQENLQARIGPRLYAVYLFDGAVTRWLARESEGGDAVQESLALLRQARSVERGLEPLERLEASWYEGLCLVELGRPEKAAPLAIEAAGDMQRILDAIESPFIRNDLSGTDCFQGLKELRGRLA